MTKPLSAPSAAPAGEPQRKQEGAQRCALGLSAGSAEDSSTSTITSGIGAGTVRQVISTNTPAGTVVSGSESRAGDAVPRTPEPDELQERELSYTELEALVAHKEAEIAQLHKDYEELQKDVTAWREHIGWLSNKKLELEAEVERLRKAHERMHKYLREIGDSNCEMCEALGERKL